MQALSIYGNATHHLDVITWTSLALAHVLEDLKDPTAKETRIGAEYELAEFSLKVGRRVKEEEVASRIKHPWSKPALNFVVK